MSVSDEILPPDILLKILVVACPAWEFELFAPTAIPITGARVLIVV